MHGSMYRTITLGGTEQEIKITGRNCDIRNDGVGVIYASTKPNITAGADGVMSVPAGQAARLRCVKGVVYMLGTGSVQLCGHDYSELVFKCAPTGGGGSGEDIVARNAIDSHANNTEIHITAAEKSNWDKNVSCGVVGENLVFS